MSEEATDSMLLFTVATLDAANSMKTMSGDMQNLIGLITGFNAMLKTLHGGFNALILSIAEMAKAISGSAIVYDQIVDYGRTFSDETSETRHSFNDFAKTIGGSAEVFKNSLGDIGPAMNQMFGGGIGGGKITRGGVLSRRVGTKITTGAKMFGGKFMAGMSSLGPQMLALTLIMKPISALMEGLLEPLEPLIDLFGMVGEVIGLLLVPIVQAIMEVLMPFMPLLVEIVTALMPIINLLVVPLRITAQMLTMLMPLLIGVVNWIGQLLGILTTISDFILNFASIITGFVTDFFQAAVDWVSNVISDFVESINAWFQAVWDSVVVDVEEWVEELKFWEG